MEKKDKVWKAVKVILAVAAVLLLVQYCSDKKETHRQQAENKAYLLAEAIHDFAEYDYPMSYEESREVLVEIVERCKDLENTADEVLKEFAEPEYDDESDRRKWWY